MLVREQAAGTDHGERLDSVRAANGADRKRLGLLEERWARERDLVEKIRELRRQVRGPSSGGNGGPSEGSPALRQRLDQLAMELREIQGENPLLQVCVDAQTVAQVVSGWTGIPVG